MKVKSSIKEFIYPPKTVTKSCHASTVLPLFDGSVVAAWFGGSEEGNDDVKIWVSIRKDEKWSEPYSIAVDGKELPHWNPVLFKRENGDIILYFKYGKPIPNWVTYYCISKDGGKSFSKPQILVPGDNDGGRGPVKNKAIRLKDGTVIAPASKETILKNWKCFVDISHDDGLTFEHSNFVLRPKKNRKTVGMIQPTLWEQPEGHIHALMRSNMAYVCESHSTDYGETWSEIVLTDIPNNNSGIDCVLAENGNIVLVCNPVAQHAGARTPLSVYLSENNGETFCKIFDLETAEGEYSYPSIVSYGNKVYITYTYKRENIMFCEIEI